MYCIELKRPEEEYFRSSFAKVVTMIDLWREKQEAIQKAMQGQDNTDVPRTVQKFSDIKGLV